MLKSALKHQREKKQQLQRNRLLDIAVIGLGNPGQKYALTRHNVGFWVVDGLSQRLKVRLKKPLFKPLLYGKKTLSNSNTVHLFKPLTYMNRSGKVLPWLNSRADFHETMYLLLADNMDLPPGSLRLKRKGGDAGHNGMKSIIQYADTKDFPRIYIGIGSPDNNTTVVDHVLGQPDQSEMESLQSAVERAIEAVIMLLENTKIEQVTEYTNKRNV
ncbi:MAG: aminoacyl-tRNA hydrolase [Spirochaetia bacterium]